MLGTLLMLMYFYYFSNDYSELKVTIKCYRKRYYWI